jgi:hypothetical protein
MTGQVSDAALNTSKSQEETHDSNGRKREDAFLTPNRTGGVGGGSSPQALHRQGASHDPWMKQRGREG